jgi:hypothetical protein
MVAIDRDAFMRPTDEPVMDSVTTLLKYIAVSKLAIHPTNS